MSIDWVNQYNKRLFKTFNFIFPKTTQAIQMKYIALILFSCFIQVSVHATANFQAFVSPNKVTLGQPTQYYIGVTFPSHYQLIGVPEKDEITANSGLDYLDQAIKKDQQGDTRIVQLSYALMSLELGEQQIPTQTVVLNYAEEENMSQVIPPQLLQVKVILNLMKKKPFLLSKIFI